MKKIVSLLLLVVYVCAQVQPPTERLYKTEKVGVFVKSIMDYENGKPSKIFYSIIGEDTIDLIVNNLDYLTLLPGSTVIAPVKQVSEYSYELIGPLRPLNTDGAQNVGTGGVNGAGINEARLRAHDFIKRIHAPFNQFGGRSHKMEPMVVGERSLVVVGINFKSKPMKATMQQVNDWIFDGTDNVDRLYNECTRGQLRFPKQKAVILGPFTIDDPVKTGSSEWLNEVKLKSIEAIKTNNGKVDVTQYDHLVMILPDFGPEDQGASGLAPVGPDCGNPCPVWINTDIMQRPVTAIGHELGHNLGWSHAGVLAEGGFNIPKPRSNVEASYGDMTALMGNGPQVCPNFPHQMTQKWVTNTQMVGKSVDNIALAPFGTPTPNAVQGIILLTNPVSSYISFRALVGPDVRFADVDKAGKGTWSNSIYVYLDVDGRKTTNIARISVGQTFNENSGQYSVTFTSVKNDVAYVNIKVNDKEDCAGNPCGANGQCIEQIGNYVCQCNKGWMGPKCSEPVCFKYKIDGFGGLSMLNGEWDRTDDYAGRVSYKIGGYVLFFAPPNKWVIGQRPAGGSGYFVYAESKEDSPQFVTSAWMGSNTRYSPTFTCLSTAPPAPVPVCSQIKGEGFQSENNLNVIFDRRADVNGRIAYTNSQSKISIFWTGKTWISGTDVKASEGPIKTDEDPIAPHAVKKWSELMASIGNKWIFSKGKFTGLGCNSGDNQVPQDCKGQWSDWNTCSAQCGGTQTRNYKVTVPSSNGGAICNTADGQVEQRPCGPPCVTPINCVGSWSNWGQCSATCGTGKQTRVYSISTTPANGGAPCPIKDGQVDSQPCNANPCPAPTPSPVPGPTPVDCRGSWSSWTACSATCGGGKQTRTFSVSQPPQNGGKPCESAPGKTEEQVCGQQPCSGGSGPVVDCRGGFSTWGSCSKTCGGGVASRTYYILQAPTPNGKPCEYSSGLQQTTPCNTQSCNATPTPGGAKVDCRGAYTQWSECSKACGAGTQTRTFYVLTEAQNGGAQCAKGDRTSETQPCTGTKCQLENNSDDAHNYSRLATPASLVGAAGIIMAALVIAVVIVRKGNNARSQSYSLL